MTGAGARQSPESPWRLVTDLPIPQLPWWPDRVEVLRWPGRRRAFGPLIAAWTTIRACRKADVFVSSTLRNALVVGIYKRLTGRRTPCLMLTEMRLDDAQNSLRWRLKVAIQRFGFRAVDLFCVSARREADAYAARFNLPRDRFRFVPWHTNVLEPRIAPERERYVFAAGRTGRDWRTLATAVADLDLHLTVVCSRDDVRTIAFPPNVTVLTDVPYTEYARLLEGASIVVIPLEPHIYSSGQVVILEAMALGKSVIVTRGVGSEDYVDDGVDGLLVEPGDVPAMRSALVELWSRKELRDALGAAALRKVLHEHTLQGYACRVLAMAEALADQARRPSRS